MGGWRFNLAAYPSSNMLVISDSAANIQRLVEIIRRIDQSTSAEVEVIPLRYASATEIVRILEQLVAKEATEPGNVPLGGGVCRQHPYCFALLHIADLVVQQHDRFGAEQPRGVEDVIGFL